MTPTASLDRSPRRLLVRGVNWLGDAVMSTPALLRLREAHAAAHVALLTPAKLADLWTHHPALDEILTFEAGEGVFSLASRLRAQNFDTTLVLPNSPRSALEVFLARIPQRIGHARPWRRWLLTRNVPARPGELKMRKRSALEVRRLTAHSGSSDHGLTPTPTPTLALAPAAHHLYQYLHLAAALGANPEPLAPQIAITEHEEAEVRRRFFPEPADKPPLLLGLNAGAEYGPAKRWPRERFVAAAVALQRRLQCCWWVFGGPAEVSFAEGLATEIAAAGGQPECVRCLAGQTTLRELCAALAACDLLLTNDTGPMHVAAAVGTPVVVPFGSTSPELTGPGLPGDPRHRLLSAHAPCSPCFRRDCPIDFRCMTGIGVDQVVEAVVRAVTTLPAAM